MRCKPTYPKCDSPGRITSFLLKVIWRRSPSPTCCHRNIRSSPCSTASLPQVRCSKMKKRWRKRASSPYFQCRQVLSKLSKHPLAPGYVFKLYLESEKRLKFGKPGWIWLTNRCIGAERIKALIKQKSIRHFCVADKWLYRVPGGVIQPVILVAKDMQLVSQDAIDKAWKTQATKEHLKELYYILSQGCGSHFLTGNVPYTKWGKFAFIDTEYPKRHFTISNAGKYLSPDMKRYWDKLLKSKGKK